MNRLRGATSSPMSMLKVLSASMASSMLTLQDGAAGRVHGGLPEGFGVHFAQTFVATDFWLFAVVLGLVLLDEGVALLFGVDVVDLLALAYMEERRLRDVEMPSTDERLHVAEEEGQQQGADMRTVNVGVAHDDDATIAQLGHVEVLTDANADGGNDVLDLLVFQHLVQASTLDVENFTAQRQDGLEMAVTTLFCTTRRR